MGHVSSFQQRDVAAVADLHEVAFNGSRAPSSPGRQAYYRTVFLENPWVDEDLPSLVYRTDRGAVAGFIGCVPRVMRYRNDSIRVAVIHRVMVDADAAPRGTGRELIDRLLAGPQRLTLVDGANEHGKRAFERSGMETVSSYSLEWVRPLRPGRLAATLASSRSAALGAVLRAAAPVADAPARHLGAEPDPLSSELSVDDELTPDLLARLLEETTRDYELRSGIDGSVAGWLLAFLEANDHRGALRSLVVRNGAEPAGVALYYLDRRGIAEFILLAARPADRAATVRLAIEHAERAGATAARGRLEPSWLPWLSGRGTVFRSGDWCLVHSRNPAIACHVHGGRAFVSALDGELWLGGPNDVL